jgi:hypothetical protein
MPMRVQDFDKEPRPTLGEELFPYKDRVPESGFLANGGASPIPKKIHRPPHSVTFKQTPEM